MVDGVAADCWAESGPAERAHRRARLSDNFTADAIELVEKARKGAKRDLVWAIGKGFCGILMGLNKNAVAAGANRGACQNWGQLAVAARSVTRSARALHGVSRVEDYLET